MHPYIEYNPIDFSSTAKYCSSTEHLEHGISITTGLCLSLARIDLSIHEILDILILQSSSTKPWDTFRKLLINLSSYFV